MMRKDLFKIHRLAYLGLVFLTAAACTTAPRNIFLIGDPPGKLRTTAFAELEEEDWQGFQKSLRFDLDNEGVPQEVEIIKSDPSHTFDANVLRAVTQWRYAPLAKEPNSKRQGLEVSIFFQVGNTLSHDCDLGLEPGWAE